MISDGLFPDPPRSAPSRTLTDSWIEPPLSVIDRRSRRWQARSAQWRTLGIDSAQGRPGGLVHTDTEYLRISSPAGVAGTSVFDPALAELILHWYSREGDRVLDPWAGGSVRGLVASLMGRDYLGIDLSETQVEANRGQGHLGSEGLPPTWIVGDSTHVRDMALPGDEYDALMTCPPYADLEVYSDDPRDLSTMDWDDFCHAYRQALTDSVHLLAQDRYAVVVIGDVRDRRGAYRGLPSLTGRILAEAGCQVIGDTVVLDPLGSKQMTADRIFRAGRLTQRVHQYMVVACTGDRMRAARRLRSSDQ